MACLALLGGLELEEDKQGKTWWLVPRGRCCAREVLRSHRPGLSVISGAVGRGRRARPLGACKLAVAAEKSISPYTHEKSVSPFIGPKQGR